VKILRAFRERGRAGIEDYLLTSQEFAEVDDPARYERYLEKAGLMLDLAVQADMVGVKLERTTWTTKQGRSLEILEGKIRTFEFRLFNLGGKWKLLRS